MREMEIEDEEDFTRFREDETRTMRAATLVLGLEAAVKANQRSGIDEAKNVANVVVVVKEEEVGELLSFSEFVFPTTDEELDSGNT